jgi:diguanylate cyclase (GGDEF)-like protein
MTRISRALGGLLDTGEMESAFGRELLKVRYRALQRQIPLVYVIALANVIGFQLAVGPRLELLLHPINILMLLVFVRLIYWVRARHLEPAPERIQIELRSTLLLTVLFSTAGGIWAIYQVFVGIPQRDLLVLFAALTGIGSAYGLSSFPAAARLPLLLFALPFSAALAMSPNLAHLGVGVSLMLITLLTLRMINVQNRGFVELVASRTVIESERERARQAEAVALAEKVRVRQMADTDPLTGLANRRAFLAALEERLAETGGPNLALALFDLDGFKPINDTFGHAAGDGVLIEVANRLEASGGDDGFAARIGGDEFALIFPCRGEAEALTMGEWLCGVLGRPYRIRTREFRISTCCGLVVLAAGQGDVTTALHCGDAALYSGKQKGRGQVALFSPELERANERRVAIERALRAPKVHSEFTLVYQPIFDLKSRAIRSFEALARWQHPELGPIAPSEFIPITEQINVNEEISDALLARAASEAAHWPDSIHLNFNLSAVQLCSGTSAQRLLSILRDHGLAPSRLHIEVTETALLADFETARVNLDRLRAAGARIVLDDFGAGYASISYLREMSFDAIKLDGSLITQPGGPVPAYRLLKGVIDLCASLNVPCVAEHIESEEQLVLLKRLGCRDGQGFGLSPPVEAQAARELAESRLVSFPRRKRSRARAA